MNTWVERQFAEFGGRVISDSPVGPSLSVQELYEMFCDRFVAEKLSDIFNRLHHLEMCLDELKEKSA